MPRALTGAGRLPIKEKSTIQTIVTEPDQLAYGSDPFDLLSRASLTAAVFPRVTKKLFIKTYGCQMNVYDSDRMASLLTRHGYDQRRASGRR